MGSWQLLFSSFSELSSLPNTIPEENNPMTLAMCLKLSHVFRSSLFCAKSGTKTILNRAMVLIYLLVLPLINIKNVNKSRK